MSDEQRFYEDDVIVVRGNEYEVEKVDIAPNGEVHQYRLGARRENPLRRLKPHEDGYTIVEYYSVDGEDITVIE